VGDPSRREVIAGLAALAASACGSRSRPSGRVPGTRPGPPLAVGSGDVDGGRARLWARVPDHGRLRVEVWGPGDKDARRVRGPDVDASTGHCGQLDVDGLGPGEHRYAISIEDAKGRRSDAVLGRVRVRGPDDPLLLAWSGDVCGQGWGLDPARGGMACMRALLATAPDVFVHSGDAIYADGPLLAEVPLPDGSVWKNVVTDAKARAATTQDELWGNFAYNLLDDGYRALLADVPVIAQWDDHETFNNWYPGEPGADEVAARARRAFLDYFAVRQPAPGRIHRVLRPHPAVDVIVLDARSFRGVNTDGREPTATAMFGAAQVRWLIEALTTSRATWKIVACDQPIGLVIPDGELGEQEGFAQGDPGAPLGREHELAQILAAVRAAGTTGVVWITADVHYAAAHRYDPARAAFTDFTPFWELIAGPIHAGVFGPQPLDATFGPEVVFQRPPTPALYGTGPAGGLMSYGTLRFDPRSGALLATLVNGDGAPLWEHALSP
jgi:alkaline phosphatase D